MYLPTFWKLKMEQQLYHMQKPVGYALPVGCLSKSQPKSCNRGWKPEPVTVKEVCQSAIALESRTRTKQSRLIFVDALMVHLGYPVFAIS